MQDHVMELAEQAKALPAEERSRLIDVLLISLHESTLMEIEAAWDAEAESRLAAYDRGEMPATDGESVLAKALEIARQ